MTAAAEPLWCFICEDAVASGTLLRYRDGRPIPRAKDAPAMSVCRACGERTSHDNSGASLRYTPFLRPPRRREGRSRRR